MLIKPHWLSEPATQRVLAALEAARPGGSRFVGGCVRNALLGLPADDLDIATQLTPEEVVVAAQAAGLAAHPTGIDHGTITVVADRRPFEVTTLRRDVETDGRRAVVAFTQVWEEDAQRRDFTMNALYLDPAGQVQDPTGEGLRDLKARHVRFIGEADTRIREDYLRILRFFRFSAFYGAGPLDAVGLAACTRLKDGLASLSAERVWKELKKLMAAPDPRPAVAAMAGAGVLSLAVLEIAESGRERFARLVETETEQMLAFDPMQRIAALLPDDPEAARAFSRRLKLSNDERARLVAALDPAQRVVSWLSMRELRRALYRLGTQAFVDRARLAWAGSVNGKAGTQWRALLALAETWTPPRFPVTGAQALAAGVPPGPLVGEALKEVEAWWIDMDFTDDTLALAERLKAVAQGLG